MGTMNWIGANTAKGHFLETLFEHMSDAILIVDTNGFLIGVNQAAERLTGWTAEELVGKVHLCTICRGMATCTQEAACEDCFARQPRLSSFEIRLRTKSGEEFPVIASSTRLPDEAMGALALILRDMTEQQRMERERFRRMMSSRMIQAQEDERRRISRELHDSIGQTLYSILVGLRVVNGLEMEESMRKLLADMDQLASSALDEVKHMAVELRPSTLDDLGLVPAIRSFVKRFEQTFGIISTFQAVGGRRRFRPEVETALYRICQEAMTNAAKYAHTDTIAVSLLDTGETVELCIKDEGCGFNPDNLEVQGTGLGLYGMKERTHLIGGVLQIRSKPGEGTEVHVVVPLNEGGDFADVDQNHTRG